MACLVVHHCVIRQLSVNMVLSSLASQVMLHANHFLTRPTKGEARFRPSIKEQAHKDRRRTHHIIWIHATFLWYHSKCVDPCLSRYVGSPIP